MTDRRWDSEPIVSRKEAKLKGELHYFTGKPCLNGHIDFRYAGKGTCVTCNLNYKIEPKKGRRIARPLADRFWEKVDKSSGVDACWPWTGTYFGTGYGRFSPRTGETISSHRVAYEPPESAAVTMLHAFMTELQLPSLKR